MIDLTAEQVEAIEQADQVPILVNPKTQEEFVLVRKELFDQMRKLMRPLSRGWDDPALDVYEEYRKKP
jgi:hypothetical protein